MEKYYLSKPAFDELVRLIQNVRATFNPQAFPAKTKAMLMALKRYLDGEFLREAVKLGSDEYSAFTAFSAGLEENCISNELFEGKDFVDPRKIFRNEIFILNKSLLELEHHPIHNWPSFKILLRLAPAWEK